MWRAAALITAICAANAAIAQCQPSGRETFAAGLEALDRGDLTAAATAFDALVQAQPDCAEARNNLAVVLVEQGRLSAAAEQLRRALELQPDYHRARLNLERVETLLGAKQPAAPPAIAAERRHAPEVTLAPTPLPAEVPTLTPTRVVESAPVAAASALPPGLAALEPEGATACVIEPARSRICVYRRSASGIVPGACYATLSARIGADVRWLTASDLTAKRIRLVDELGRKRLKIVDDHSAAAADVVQLCTADFIALSAQVVPWRTGWVVQAAAGVAPRDSVAVAAEVRTALEQWRQAWEQKQFDAYLAMYGAAFSPQADGVAGWKARKKQLFEQSLAINVQVRAPSFFVLDDATVITTFLQYYRSGVNSSLAAKALRWQPEGTRWTITAETVLNEAPAL